MKIEPYLIQLGFIKEGIVEGIISTYNLDGNPNAAPMGISVREPSNLIVKPYKTSRTFVNLSHNSCAVLNLTTDPEVFLKTSLKGVLPEVEIPPEWFDKAEVVNAPKLRNADASIEIDVIDTQDFTRDRAILVCAIRNIVCTRKTPQAYCRAIFAVIESAVHATRVERYKSSGNEEEAKRLIEYIRHYKEIVKRVSPNSRYEAMMKELISFIERISEDSL